MPIIMSATRRSSGASLSMSYTPVTSATYNVAYTGATPSTSGGTAPYTYSMQAGTLPAGLSLNTSTGVISGTPTNSSGETQAGLVLRVTDSAGSPAHIDSSSFTITSSAAAWTPASLGANLIAWYQAANASYANISCYTDAGSTLATNGQTIQQWNDSSGNGRHLKQPTSGRRPAWQSAGYNSHPAIKFTASTITGMKTDALASILASGDPASFFAVGQMLTGTAAYGRFVTTAADASAQDANDQSSLVPMIRDNTANTVEGFAITAGPLSPNSVSLATNYRFGFIRNGNTVTSYLNNSAATPGTVGGVSFTGWNSSLHFGVGMGLGTNAAFDTTSPWDGPMTELVITNTALDSTTRGLLDTYFTTKWGT